MPNLVEISFVAPTNGSYNENYITNQDQSNTPYILDSFNIKSYIDGTEVIRPSTIAIGTTNSNYENIEISNDSGSYDIIEAFLYDGILFNTTNYTNWYLNIVLYNGTSSTAVKSVKITGSETLIADLEVASGDTVTPCISEEPFITPSEIYKYFSIDSSKVQTDSAIRDEDGNRIDTIYAKKDELSNITSIDVSIEEGFSVTITFNESHLNYKLWLRIYDGNNTTGTLLFEDTSTNAIGTTTVICESGYLYINVYSLNISGAYAVQNSIVGDITLTDTNDSVLALIASDGSFTIDCDYDD